MVSYIDSKGSTFTNSTFSNATSEHSLSSNSYVEDPLNMTALNVQQLMDNLAIIDDLYDTYGQELESDKENVATVARNVANKYKVLQDLNESEVNYIQELQHFQEYYIDFILQWIENNINTKIKIPLPKPLHVYQDLIFIHQAFLKDLTEREKIWGPSQIVSDVFMNLYSLLDIYDAFFKNYSNLVMTINQFYGIQIFVKQLENHMNNDHQYGHNILYYLRLPIFRFQAYLQALSFLVQFSDPSHVDYDGLHKTLNVYKQKSNQILEKMMDCQRLFEVLEANRTIYNCPIEVTPNRRLLLKSRLIKVDLDDLTSTSDVRTYILYNDQLIFCRKDKKQDKLQYKGALHLENCELRVLSPAICAKMAEVKKSILLSFRSKKASAANSLSAVPPATAYGFELITPEVSMDVIPGNFENAMSTAGTPLKRRHMIRTQSLEEQDLWVNTLRKVIKNINLLQAN
ncbi:unnamed protein product [Cunninghamella echinulata]